MAIPLLIENRMFKNPLENEKVPVGEHTPVRYFQSLSTYLIHNVAFISFHIRDNRLSNDHRFIQTVSTVTMVNLGKGNKRRARGSGAGGSRVHHRAVTQTPLPSEAASSLSHHSHTQPVHLILLWRLAVRLCVCCAFTGQCSSTAPGWKCVFRGKAAFRQRDSEHNTPHSLVSATFNRSECLSENACGLRRRSMARPMRPRGEKSRGKSDRGP